MFKIYDSTAVDSSDDEDKMDYLSESSGSEAIGSSLMKQQIFKNIIGLHNGTELKAFAYARFGIFPFIRPFG